MLYLIILIVVCVCLVILLSNSLVGKRNRVEQSFATIDTYLEKRFDELGSLFEQLTASMDHESDVYIKVAKARSGLQSGDMNTKIEAMNAVSGIMAHPMMKTEAYPELKSIETMGLFTAKATSSVEDNIAAARKTYNKNVTAYNNALEMFPMNIIASMTGHKEKFALLVTAEEKKVRPGMAPRRS